MSLESPESYGEQYWKPQVDALKLFEEDMEKGMAQFVPTSFITGDIRAAMPGDILQKMDALFSFPAFAAGKIASGVLTSTFSSVENTVVSVGMRGAVYAANKLYKNEIIDPPGIVNQFRHCLFDDVQTMSYLSMYGYGEIEANLLLQSTKEYPPLSEVIRWGRYQESGTNIWNHIGTKYRVESVDRDIWDFMTQQQLTTDQILTLWKRKQIEVPDMAGRLGEVGWFGGTIPFLQEMSFVIPNAMLLLQADLITEESDEQIADDLRASDIHPNYHQKYIDAVKTKPASLDLVAYHLRQENELADLERDLTRIGVHPEFLHVYETLAHRLPPLADIISMAVREAFSPAVAQRFGQYEDFPADFGKYAEQQGMSEEWAKRYWAAHWGLPSPQQGFEMLHRGVIGESDLEMLMKAQDIMPFWREKMVEIAYRPLTRVDVRRMYKEGILDAGGVYDAYLDNGYSEENAENMTEFTIAYVLQQQSKFTTADVVKAYTNRMIESSEARSLLIMIGMQSADVSYVLDTADYKREWEITDNKTAAIRNLYKKGEYNENTARSELLRLDLPSDHVDTLMETWWFEKAAEGVKTWTKAETMGFMASGLITAERGRQELIYMGYDDEHADTYIKAQTWTPPEE